MKLSTLALSYWMCKLRILSLSGDNLTGFYFTNMAYYQARLHLFHGIITWDYLQYNMWKLCYHVEAHTGVFDGCITDYKFPQRISASKSLGVL